MAWLIKGRGTVKRIHPIVIAAIGLTLFAQSGTGQASCASSGPSSRACLIAIADQYFAALAAHDPSKAPMATNTRFMERPIAMPPVRGGNAGVTNSPAVQGIKIGEGLWKTITEGVTGFKIYVPDLVLQEVGGIAMIKVENQPTALGFRLKLENGRITEAHHVLVKISDPAALAYLTTPRPEFIATVPPADRLSRDALRALAYSSYDAKQQNVRPLPLTVDCVRRENGMPMSSCGAPLTTSQVSYIDGLSLGRFGIADPESGLVFTLTYNFPSGGLGAFIPLTFGTAHINKVQGNGIHAVEAIGVGGTPRAWNEFTR